MEEQALSNTKNSDLVPDSFRPADAPGIVRLFCGVYGNGYPVKTFYDPEALIAANKEGSIISTVIRTAAGEIIGHVACFRSAPYEKLYEVGSGLVLPAYRHLGLIRSLMEYLLKVGLERAQAEELFGEAVCNHLAIQKSIAPLGLSEYALEVDLMPAEAYTQEQSAKGRVSTVLAFGKVRTKRHTVYLPTVYRTELEYLYGELSVERTMVWEKNDLPAVGNSRAKMDIFDFAQVARIAIHAIGADFADLLTGLEKEAEAKDVKVFQLWLSLASPYVDGATDFLRTRGFFLGGILPRWFDVDGLLMQKVTITPNWDGLYLLSDRAKEIETLVRKDWEAVRTVI